MIPNLEDVKEYLGLTSVSDDVIDAALLVETMAQFDMCRIPLDPGEFPEPLAEALKRRVARNLALRNLPLAIPSANDADSGVAFIPGRDPEIRRLEAPYRRLVVG